jgi:hypothetical protein
LEDGEGLLAPATLCVNSESRQDVNHYFILRKKIGYSQPDFFNPALDRVYILAWKLYSFCLDVYLDSLQADGTDTDLFTRAKSLEVQIELHDSTREVARTVLHYRLVVDYLDRPSCFALPT